MPKKVIDFHVQKSELQGTVTIRFGDDEFVMDRACAILLAKGLNDCLYDWAFRYALDNMET